jgi:hypothetical protein
MPDLIIIPRPEEKPARAQWLKEVHEQLVDRWNPPFELPNIEFHYHHDDFFNRNLSMRAARDWKNHPFWFYIAVLFFMGNLGLTGISISFRLFAPYVPYMPSWL